MASGAVYTITPQGRVRLTTVVGPARYYDAVADVLICATQVDGVDRTKAWLLPP